MVIVKALLKAKALASHHDLKPAASFLLDFLDSNPNDYAVLRHLVFKRLNVDDPRISMMYWSINILSTTRENNIHPETAFRKTSKMITQFCLKSGQKPRSCNGQLVFNKPG